MTKQEITENYFRGMTNEMGRCKDCKWWEQYPNPGYPTEPDIWELCNHKVAKDITRYPVPPDFGCIHFDNKTDGGDK